MKTAHLTASTFFGGPERQMLGLAQNLPAGFETLFISFAEGGRCQAFINQARKDGFEAVALRADTPRFRAAVAELADELGGAGVGLLCCHGYKANLLGRLAARRLGIPAVAVARGWTGESFKVRCYEALDRWHLPWTDHVVCVSEAQAAKVRRAGVPVDRVTVIANAVDTTRFADADPLYRNKLLRAFRQPTAAVVGAAGRLSPEKGFHVLVQAAEIVRRSAPDVGFVLFGAGPCRTTLADQVKKLGLTGSFALKGYRPDLDRFIPFFDLLVLPSFTEGLPNVVLEACAAGVPVVATAVGGTPEIVTDGASGYLVAPGNPALLAERILTALASPERLRDMSARGRQTVGERFTFARQAAQYRQLFDKLTYPAPSGVVRAAPMSAAETPTDPIDTEDAATAAAAR
jgi:glycosyltransferase involved in cell wall biosynthesis